MRKIGKNSHPPKGMRSCKQLFFPYPSVFAKSYVRCVERNAKIKISIKFDFHIRRPLTTVANGKCGPENC